MHTFVYGILLTVPTARYLTNGYNLKGYNDDDGFDYFLRICSMLRID